jgi:deoxycytidylate deaminase
MACGVDKALGSDLYVTRVLRNDKPSLARPCKSCQAMIYRYGIRNVFYSTGDGYARL